MFVYVEIEESILYMKKIDTVILFFFATERIHISSKLQCNVGIFF